MRHLRFRLLSRLTHSRTITLRRFHKNYNAAREEQSFKLPDGRTMGFAEYGNLEGTPAFFLHGAPGSRYDGIGLIDIAKKLNVRIICPDRPGHGLSSFQPDRKLGDYPNDISQLAKHLGTAQYNVFGQSGGGPYAVACAYGLPKDEILNVAVVAVAALSAQKWIPSVMRFLTNWYLKDDKRLQKSLYRMYKYLTEEDRAEITKPEAESLMMASLKAAYAQGPNGVIRDGQLYITPWDFELKDIQKEIKLFDGHKDDRTPLVFGRYYKANLPKAELIEFEDASHFTVNRHDEEIMSKLVGSGLPKRTPAIDM
ncbi:MAG: hypothetical protein Q9164_002193 [Protoblastenia rupestris]